LRHQTHVIDSLPAPLSGLRAYETAEQLVVRLRPFPIRYFLQHEIIGLYEDGSVGVYNGREFLSITPRSIIIATGASESALPFPGWTLPGVMTIGAAQILINRERVYPGKATLVVGSSDMALEVAEQMHDVGIHVLAVVEGTEQIRARDANTITSFRRTGIPVLFQTEMVSANGRRMVEEVILRRVNENNAERAYSLDFVCIDGGRQPILEVLSLLNCQVGYQLSLGGWLPRYTSDLQASVSGVFVAGQAAGVTCHAGIYFTGALAGIGAVDYLEEATTEERKSSKQKYWDELRNIEAANLPDVWQARLSHIKSLSVADDNVTRIKKVL
jgi:sarcosine oxidase subunit alpha